MLTRRHYSNANPNHLWRVPICSSFKERRGGQTITESQTLLANLTLAVKKLFLKSIVNRLITRYHYCRKTDFQWWQPYQREDEIELLSIENLSYHFGNFRKTVGKASSWKTSKHYCNHLSRYNHFDRLLNFSCNYSTEWNWTAHHSSNFSKTADLSQVYISQSDTVRQQKIT